MKKQVVSGKKFMKVTVFGTLAVFIATMIGCAAGMHGYTQRRANNKYWIVDQETESFGYKRMQYSMGFFRTLKGFVREHGLPDFIYEYSPSATRDALRMYYVQDNKVFIFEQEGFLPDSLFLKDVRDISEPELNRYNRMLRRQP